MYSTARPSHRVNQLASAAIGAFAAVLVAGALKLTAGYVANREQFGRPLSTFQTVAAQLAEVYIASRTTGVAANSVVWRLAEGRDADDDIDELGYWLTSQAPPAMQTCHHLHGGMGMDITYPMHRYTPRSRTSPVCWVAPLIASTWWSAMFIELPPSSGSCKPNCGSTFRISSRPRAGRDGGRPAR